MLAHSLFFYFFSTIAVFAAIMVTVSRNTVYSVFFLILVFISISILFIMIGAEFLGMIMLDCLCRSCCGFISLCCYDVKYY